MKPGAPFGKSWKLDGAGVESDDSLAYEWLSIGASKMPAPINVFANALRDNAAKGLSPAELEDLQALVRELMSGAMKLKVPPLPPSRQPST